MKQKQEKPRCSAKVFDSTGWHTSQCMKNATAERDGKDYCKTHDPVAKRERQDKRIDASRAAYADKQARHDACRVEFVQRLIQVAHVSLKVRNSQAFKDAAAKLVDDIVGTGMSWGRG